MYTKHSKLSLSYPDTQKIWRYINFEKCKSLIEDSALFFCRADKFKDDKWEGVLPIKVIEKYMLEAKTLPSDDGDVYSYLKWHKEKEARSHLINCWHVNDKESFAMWKIYCQDHHLSIAIQSSIGRLKKSFDATKERIWVGEVEYIDFREKEFGNRIFNVNIPNTLKTFLLKWHYFTYEKEIRAILNKAYSKHKEKIGIPVKIDLSKLVDCIYLSPTAGKEDEKKIRDLLEHNNCSFNIKRSDLGMKLYM